jgi:hypothetical protein
MSPRTLALGFTFWALALLGIPILAFAVAFGPGAIALTVQWLGTTAVFWAAIVVAAAAVAMTTFWVERQFSVA